MQVSAGLQLLCSAALLLQLLQLLQLQGCCAAVKGWTPLNNDATETLAARGGAARARGRGASNSSQSVTNRAKQGGRAGSAAAAGPSELGCRSVQSSRSVSDGWCRSSKPVRELQCSGRCLPSRLLPNAIVGGKWWRSGAADYRCIPAHARTRRVPLQCPDGNTRTYKLRVVTSCKCKRFRPQHNQSEARRLPEAPRRRKQDRQPWGRGHNGTPLTHNSY